MGNQVWAGKTRVAIELVVHYAPVSLGCEGARACICSVAMHTDDLELLNSLRAIKPCTPPPISRIHYLCAHCEDRVMQWLTARVRGGCRILSPKSYREGRTEIMPDVMTRVVS